jgi:hypothetical protein
LWCKFVSVPLAAEAVAAKDATVKVIAKRGKHLFIEPTPDLFFVNRDSRNLGANLIELREKIGVDRDQLFL